VRPVRASRSVLARGVAGGSSRARSRGVLRANQAGRRVLVLRGAAFFYSSAKGSAYWPQLFVSVTKRFADVVDRCVTWKTKVLLDVPQLCV